MSSFIYTWNGTFEAQPDDSEDAKQGASRIRNLKTAISERMKVDHSWAGDANDGAHLQVTLLEASADPASALTTGFLYGKAVSGLTELFYENSGGTVQQITSGNSLISQAPPGTGMDFWGSSLPAGYVWANGLTIGDGSSGATGFADASTQALFTVLWNASTNTQLPVSGGRGANAAADFGAHKTITVPDKRGRVSAGRETMGGSAGTTRLTVAVSGIDGTLLATAGGDQNTQQHNHTLTDLGHIHTAQYFLGGPPGPNGLGGGGSSPSQVNTTSATTGITLAAFGTGAAQNAQPTIVCNYIIKL
jgi:hypothetical protein